MKHSLVGVREFFYSYIVERFLIAVDIRCLVSQFTYRMIACAVTILQFFRDVLRNV